MAEDKSILGVNPLSRVVTPIWPWCGSMRLPHATGFFWKHGHQCFLVSNWHVFSGRNARTGQPLEPHGGCPDRLQFVVHRDLGGGKSVMDALQINIQREGQNLWLEHPLHGQRVDVAAIPLGEQFSFADVLNAQSVPETADLRIDVGQELFILGYPLEPKLTDSLPVWKRGTIASEPNYDVSQLPQLLIDSATRPGMSGSFVFARSLMGYVSESGRQALNAGHFYRRIGVYSGRLGADEIDKVQLGVVWRIEVVDTICGGQKIGEPKLSD
jgi:hypothetical protein